MAQKVVRGDRGLAEAIAETGELIEFASGQNVIEQGAGDRDVYFLLAGKVQIIINGFRLYPREHGELVGEMSAINPHISRSATLEAIEPTVAWRIDHERLAEIGDAHPQIWRFIAKELAGRIEQRNRFISRANLRPQVFFICSAEALAVARALRVGLEYDAEVTIWGDERIFAPGAYPIEALEEQVNLSDFGVALVQPDDLVLSRDRKSMTPRDNVIFELGFFMSRLGRHRTFLLVPRDENVKLPSDFKGLTPITYNATRVEKELPKALGPTIDKIIGLLKSAGVRSSLVQAR